ncbi:MAG TPA: MBL fold metallo-hydrolase, partial [Dehalococcoidia bacterium]|nr:MBL fold metallo-hydrolase [Dehalococcoidia bacterium]
IDSGLPNRKATILGALNRMGRRPEDLKHIAITHHHVDHTGSLAALAGASGAAVYVHPADAPIVRGDRPVPGPNPRSILGKIVHPLIGLPPLRSMYTLSPARVDREVQDGEELPVAGGLKAVHTPGHTAGHLSYLMPGHDGVLFAGDAAGNLFGRLGPPLGMYTEDMAQAKQSLSKLAALEFDTACFGHGRVLKGKANVAFRRLVERLAR